MGIVDEVGPEVTKFKKGDRVVASFLIAWVYSLNCGLNAGLIISN